jgi:hypothetical protein
MSKIKHPNSMLGLGIALGAGIGVAFNALALGAGLGVAFGVAMRQALIRKQSTSKPK